MRRLSLPFVPFLAAIVVQVVTGTTWLEAPTLPDVQRIILAVVFVLAWRLRRGRIAWATLALAAVAELPLLGLETHDSTGIAGVILVCAGLWLAIDLAAASLLREWWVLSVPGAVRLAVLLAQGLSIAWLARAPEAQTHLEALQQSWLARWPALQAAPLPPLLAAGLAIALILVSIAAFRRRTPLEAGLLAALCACAAAFTVVGGLRFYLAAAGLCLAVALVENAFSLAFNDGLTGLPARRALEERLEQLGRSYSLAMLDLDHFKKLNDRHGHEVGDQVLKLVASRLRKVQGGGEAFRYGGEEFTVVFAGRGAEEAVVYLDALRQQIASRPFIVRSPGRPTSKPKKAESRPKTIEKSLKVTVSIGVAERGEKAPTPETVMKAADRALYKSKKAGRNRVMVG